MSIYKFGHKFDKVGILSSILAKCSQCEENVSYPERYRCELCKLTLHKGCIDKLDSRQSCTKSSTLDIIDLQHTTSGTPHHFKVKTFLKPTFCKHCGELIMGLVKQGKECLEEDGGCGMKIDFKCETVVCCPCRKMEDPSEDVNNNRVHFGMNNISIRDFDLIKSLGEGGFGKVYLAKLRAHDKEYAIKTLKKTDHEVDPSSVENEKEVLRLGGRFPFLTKVYCCFQTRERLFFVLEYVKGNTLYEYIYKGIFRDDKTKIHKGKFTENRARFHGAEIALALMFLHGRNIVHRDLKSEHVMIDTTGHVKLLDFGASKVLDPGCDLTTTICGTYGYMSPEMLDGSPHGKAVDWWAYGVLMYEMMTGDKPYPEDPDDPEVYKQSLKTSSVGYPKTLSSHAQSLLRGLLAKKPEERLGCRIIGNYEKELRDHPFFSTEDKKEQWWKDIENKRKEPPFRVVSECLEDDDDTRPSLSPSDSGVDFNGFSYCSESFNYR